VAVAPDGTVFVGAGDRVVSFRTASGVQLWESLGEQARTLMLQWIGIAVVAAFEAGKVSCLSGATLSAASL
jgi:hypothetical protein